MKLLLVPFAAALGFLVSVLADLSLLGSVLMRWVTQVLYLGLPPPIDKYVAILPLNAANWLMHKTHSLNQACRWLQLWAVHAVQEE